MGRGGEVWRTHHIATIRKVRNRLGNISTRAKGLVIDDGVANDLPWARSTDRGVYVVDVAGVDPLAQDLVFARVVSKLREHLERRDLGVDHVVVFVDELNKYAPADGPDTYVRKMLLDLAERGRYLGLVLFSAQQFRSQVQRRVVGNAGTGVFGRMDMDELATPGYAHPLARHQDQARHAAQGRADDPASALHPADLRALPAPGDAERPRRGGALSPGGRAAVRRRGGAPAAAARPRASRPTRSAHWSRAARDATCAVPWPPRAATRPDDVLAFFVAELGRRVGGEVVTPRSTIRPVPERRRSLRSSAPARGAPLATAIPLLHSPLVKLAHLADSHLGIRQYHRQTPTGINQREADVANAFRAVIDDVIACRPDVVIFAGDLFHSVRPTNAAIVFAFRQFQRLREALPEAPVILVAGNHDTPRSSETGSILQLFEELGVSSRPTRRGASSSRSSTSSVLAVPHQALIEPEELQIRPTARRGTTCS